VLSRTIDQYLPFFKEDFREFLKVKEVSFYYYNISSSTASHLFWIWNNGINLSDEALNDFVDSFFLGVFGYKMIDFQNDNRNSNPELSFVGLYAIKIAEQLLEKILGKEITSQVYLKYAKMYTEIEYLEKLVVRGQRSFVRGQILRADDQAAAAVDARCLLDLGEVLLQEACHLRRVGREVEVLIQKVARDAVDSVRVGVMPVVA